MSYVKKRSVLPVYFIGGTWLVWSLLFPLYRPTHYVMAALVSAVVYFVGKMIFPDRGYEIKEPAQAQPQPHLRCGQPNASRFHNRGFSRGRS